MYCAIYLFLPSFIFLCLKQKTSRKQRRKKQLWKFDGIWARTYNHFSYTWKLYKKNASLQPFPNTFLVYKQPNQKSPFLAVFFLILGELWGKEETVLHAFKLQQLMLGSSYEEKRGNVNGARWELFSLEFSWRVEGW